MLSRFFGNSKSKPRRSNKENCYAKLGFHMDDSEPYQYIYSIEEDTGVSLKEEYLRRMQVNVYFTFDEILLIMQSLVSGVYQLHRLGIPHKQISLENAYWQKDGVVKLSAVCDPVNDWRERIYLYSGEMDLLIYLSPDNLSNDSTIYYRFPLEP